MAWRARKPEKLVDEVAVKLQELHDLKDQGKI
jgi:hypothetical protein